MYDDEFGGFDDEIPGDEVLQVVESGDGVTTSGVAAAAGLPQDVAEERLEALRSSGEVERDADGEWFVPEQAGADDPYVF